MITILIIITTGIISFISFPQNAGSYSSSQRSGLFDKLKFNAYMVYKRNEWFRMFSSGLLHANWSHLIFNMLTLFFFGVEVEKAFRTIFGVAGPPLYFTFYVLALGVSSISDLIKHKNNHYYNAVGASGAVSAVLFAAILIDPGMSLYMFFIPIPIPALVFGPAYLIYSYYMGKRQMDNIGHDAHFWGAVFGFVFPIILKPILIVAFIAHIASFFA